MCLKSQMDSSSKVSTYDEKSPIAKIETHGKLEGRKVSRWENLKAWTYNNRKALAVVAIIIGVAAALTGLGLVLSAALGTTAIVSATTTSGITMSGMTPALGVTVKTAFTTAGKMLIGGAVSFIAGIAIVSGSSGYLAGVCHK